MKQNVKSFLGLLLAVVLLAACEKMSVGDEESSIPVSGANVVIKVSDLEAGWTATRAPVSIAEVCSRLCFAVYQDGSRVKYENQKAGDAGFGTFAIKLAEGTYQLLAVGHSGAANPATTNPAKIQFSNPGGSNGTGFTDTFYYYGTLEVGSDGARLDISMQRATAMFRLKTKDVKPAEVKKFQFYYEGGSGTLDATTGYGCVNSKQSVFVETGDDLTGHILQFEMYTFPHQETDEVSFTVKAFDANEAILYEKDFTNIKIKRDCITQYSGEFFTDGDVKTDPETPSGSNVIMVDPEWSEIFEYTF